MELWFLLTKLFWTGNKNSLLPRTPKEEQSKLLSSSAASLSSDVVTNENNNNNDGNDNDNNSVYVLTMESTENGQSIIVAGVYGTKSDTISDAYSYHHFPTNLLQQQQQQQQQSTYTTPTNLTTTLACTMNTNKGRNNNKSRRILVRKVCSTDDSEESKQFFGNVIHHSNLINVDGNGNGSSSNNNNTNNNKNYELSMYVEQHFIQTKKVEDTTSATQIKRSSSSMNSSMSNHVRTRRTRSRVALRRLFWIQFCFVLFSVIDLEYQKLMELIDFIQKNIVGPVSLLILQPINVLLIVIVKPMHLLTSTFIVTAIKYITSIVFLHLIPNSFHFIHQRVLQPVTTITNHYLFRPLLSTCTNIIYQPLKHITGQYVVQPVANITTNYILPALMNNPISTTTAKVLNLVSSYPVPVISTTISNTKEFLKPPQH